LLNPSRPALGTTQPPI